jgi:serine/threonine protein kinase
MLQGLDGLSEDTLVRWTTDSLAVGSHRIGHGVQGQALLYEAAPYRLVIKAPSGRGLRKWLATIMLRHEARVYERLHDFPAVPRYYGLLDGRYLVLEYIDGELARYAAITDREAFYTELLGLIQALHARGIAHSDLQKKDNLLIASSGHPCLLDFGAAVIRKPGFAPINHLHFRFARRLDLNQWVKLKYRGQLDQLSAEDAAYYRRTWLERFARRFKRLYRKPNK